MKKLFLFVTVAFFAVALVRTLPVRGAGEPLTISAPVTLSGTNTVSAPTFIDTTGSGAYFIDPSAATSLVVAGNVGIGTVSPGYSLHVKNSANTLAKLETTAASNSQLRFADSGAERWAIGSDIDGAGANGKFQLWALAGTTGAKMTIQNDGNVGIGTTGPTGKLQVDTAAASSLNTLVLSQLDTAYFAQDVATAGRGIRIRKSGSPTSTYAALAVDTTTGADGDLFNVKWNGNVGIGTTAPDSILDVQMPSGTNGVNMFRLTSKGNSNTDIGQMLMRHTDATSAVKNTGVIRWDTTTGTNGYLRFYAAADVSNAMTHAMTLDGMGRVGIGITSPAYKLQVEGYTSDWNVVINVGGQPYGIYAAGTSYAGYFQGPGYLAAGAWQYGSDRRLKENIQYYSDKHVDALGIIGQLKPVSFDYIKHTTGINEDGFIAQDVQQVLPQLVGTDTKGMLTLKTTNLIPYLVKGIQEQQTQIEELKGKVEDQQAQIDELRELIKAQ